MAVATGTALLIGAGISAAAQAGGAALQSKAAGKAADQQVASADKGLELQKQIYGQQVAGMQPYAQFGQQALGSLGSLMGFPAMPASGATAASGMAATDPMVANVPAGRRSTPETATGEFAVPRAGTLGGMVGQSSYRSPQATPGGSMGAPMVTLIAPTGEQGQFPADQAEMFIQRGARRVG